MPIKKLKAIIATVLMLTLVACTLPIALAAEEEITYSYMIDSDPVCGFGGKLTFNEAKLEFVSAYIIRGANSQINHKKNYVKFAAGSSSDDLDLRGGRVLFSVVFKPKGDITREDITVAFDDFFDTEGFTNGKNIPFSYTETINGSKVGGGYIDLDDPKNSTTEPGQGIFAAQPASSAPTLPVTSAPTESSTQPSTELSTQTTTQLSTIEPGTVEPSESSTQISTGSPNVPASSEPAESPSVTPTQDVSEDEHLETVAPTKPADISSNYKTGDVNRDGSLDIIDVTLIQKYLVNLISFDDEQLSLADVDNNGSVKIQDATRIQYILLKIG